MGVQEDFGRLHAVSQQSAAQFQPRQHHGPSLGGLVTVGLLAWGVAEAVKNQRDEDAGLRPRNLKDRWVLFWYVVGAVLLHIAAGFVTPNPAFYWLVFGTIIWIPTWILGIRHQKRNRAYNRMVWDQFNNPGSTTITVEQVAPGPKVADGFDAWWRAQKNQD